MRHVAEAISKRVAWALAHHPQVLMQQRRQQHVSEQPMTLWGVAQPLNLNTENKLAYYREQLQAVIPELFAKWQPIVGAAASVAVCISACLSA